MAEAVRSAGHVDDLELGEFQQAFFAEFRTEAGETRAAKGNVRREIGMLVDPDRAALHFQREIIGIVVAGRPDRAAKPVVGRIGAGHRIIRTFDEVSIISTYKPA